MQKSFNQLVMKKNAKELFKSRLNEMSDDHVEKIIKDLINLTGDEINPQDIFPIGIRKPDEAQVKFVLTPEKHKTLVERLTKDLNNPVFKEFKVFPLGIILNEYYETQITLRGGLGS